MTGPMRASDWERFNPVLKRHGFKEIEHGDSISVSIANVLDAGLKENKQNLEINTDVCSCVQRRLLTCEVGYQVWECTACGRPFRMRVV